jgi:mannose-1-phosphate guanylyltransferase
MRAIVLVGGEGTRLRPLTLRTLKQLVPILNRPLLEHLLLHLKSHGVLDVRLAMTRHSERVETHFGDGSQLGMRLDYMYEESALGSGGAIAQAAAGWNEPFLVCNGDLLTDLDVTAMIAAHQARGAELSIALYEVEDPSPFGVVVLDGDERVTRFVEKPPRETAPSQMINAGTWLFDPKLLAEMDPTRFNRVEDELFPALASAGRPMFGFTHDGFWLDVGNPDVYLHANLEIVGGALPALLPSDWPSNALATSSAQLDSNANVTAPALVGKGSTIASGAELRGPVVTGRNVSIAANASVSGSVLWDDVTIGAGAIVADSVLADGSRVGAGAVVRGVVLGQRAEVADGDEPPVGTRVAPDTRWSAGEA